jgi:hypothetical protein
LERKQGILGGFLGQPRDDDRGRSAPDGDTDDEPTPEKTEAYEEDWYRSLKALAERQQALSGDDEVEELTEEPIEAAAERASAGLLEDRPDATITEIAELVASEPPTTDEPETAPAVAEPPAPPPGPS